MTWSSHREGSVKSGNEEGEREVASYSLTFVPVLLLYNSRSNITRIYVHLLVRTFY